MAEERANTEEEMCQGNDTRTCNGAVKPQTASELTVISGVILMESLVCEDAIGSQTRMEEMLLMRRQSKRVLKRTPGRDVLEREAAKKPKFQIQKNRDDRQKGRHCARISNSDKMSRGEEMMGMDKVSALILQKRDDQEHSEKQLRSGDGHGEGASGRRDSIFCGQAAEAQVNESAPGST